MAQPPGPSDDHAEPAGPAGPALPAAGPAVGPAGEPPVPPGPLHDEIRSLTAHLDRARSAGPADASDDAVAGLEQAIEELRTAEEELRTQQEQIADLVEARDRLLDEHERLLAALPVPAVVTDPAGVVRVANQAAATLVGVGVLAMIGKPVFTFFQLADRPALRSLVSARSRGERPFRHRATLLGRRREPAQVEITAVALPGLAPDVCWLVVEDVGIASLATPTGARLPDVLVRLAALPAAHDTADDLLLQATTLCQVALGEDVDVSLVLGSPAAPTASASTDSVAQHLDEVQSSHASGPSVDAFDQRVTIVTADVRVDPRWTDISAVVPGGLGGVVATPLTRDGTAVGALTVYRSMVGADTGLVESTVLIAATLSSVLDDFALRAELRRTAADDPTARTSRTVIRRATSIVVADLGCTEEEALAHLVQLAGRHDAEVHDVAQVVVDRAGALQTTPRTASRVAPG